MISPETNTTSRESVSQNAGEEVGVTRLSRDEFEELLRVLDTKQTPNKALRTAAASYRSRVLASQRGDTLQSPDEQ